VSSAIIFAFTAGAVSTVNPCGFALLPAWFARQIAGREGDSTAHRFLRAVLNGGAATLGFVVVFSLAAAILGSGANWVGAVLPYAGVSIGAALIILGLVSLIGIKVRGFQFLDTCRRANERFGAFGFGLSYGFISLSCSLPVFMAAVGVSFFGTDDLALAGVVAFLVGAGSVLAIISAVAALAGSGIFAAVGSHHGALKKASGALTAAAGLYIFVYWGRSLFGRFDWASGMLEEGGYWSSSLHLWLSEGAGPSVLLVMFLAILSVAWVLWRRSRAIGEKSA